MAEDSHVIQRLTNLTFALLDAPEPRPYEWIRTKVAGYENKTDVGFSRMLARDVRSLKRAGVPARMENGTVWINKDVYELPPISFTEDEAFVLGLAGDLGTSTSLGAFARSGWTKIAAGGATRTFDEPPIAALDNDISRLEPDIVAAVTACVRSQTRMRFIYRPAPAAQPQTRTMDPWGIVALNNRAYVVGYDVEREAERSFRAVRISDVKKVKADEFHEPTRPLQQVVEDSLRGPTIDVVLRVDPGTASELTDRAFPLGDGTYSLESVERDWLVRTVASFAPHVIVQTPPDVRADVLELLSSAASSNTASPSAASPSGEGEGR